MRTDTWRLAEAADLDERLSGVVEPDSLATPDDVEQAQRLWHGWQILVASGDPIRWQRRAAHTGRSDAELERLLGPARWCGNDEAPWSVSVQRLLAELPLEPVHAPHVAPTQNPVPFLEMLAPLVEVGRRRVLDRVGDRRSRLSGRAWTQLEGQLAWRLARTSEPSLGLDFSIYRARRRSSIERLVLLATQPGTTRLYEEFVDRHRATGLMAVVARYPALARAWARLVDDWVDGTAELVDRLDADAEALARFLGQGDSLPPVSALETELSDRHHGGRTVSLLHFDGDAQLIYKPRNIDVEAGWSALLEWLSSRGAPVDLRGLAVLTRPTHGWVEVARSLPCTSADEFPAFYRRAGALLCLVHLLAGNDCHRENLIAVGDHPVLVDVETLLHPGTSPVPDDIDDAHARLTRSLEHSVLGTALLPHWSPVPSGGGYESGGIGPGGRMATSISARVPRGRNTDELVLEPRCIDLAATKNVPFADGIHAAAEDHVEALIAGFEAMARFVTVHRDALLGQDGPVQAFAGMRVRVLLRGTPVYAQTLQRSLVPEAMRSGAARSVALESLARPVTHPSFPAASEPAAWAMLEHERHALERLDIPRFELRADASAVAWRPTWCRSGLELARGRIVGLCEREIARQSALVRASFEARSAGRDVVRSSGASMAVEPATVAEIRAIAEQIVARVEALATHGAGNTATWLSADVMGESGAYRLRPMGSNLYGGFSGVALFLAAAGSILGDEQAKALALDAIRPARDVRFREELAGMPIGGAMGIASTAYALLWMGRLLDDESLIDDAAAILERIGDAAIEADRHHDLAGGAAGAILVLLAVDRVRPGVGLLDRARRCGEHLLRSRVGEPASWPTATGLRLAGLSHGASGTAWALESLGIRLGNAQMVIAAREAVQYERTLLSHTHGNWRDLRPDVPPDEPCSMISWCNGAAGIGMARLRQSADQPGRDEELSIAVRTTCDRAFGALDHFCCGNVGRAELLLDAGHRLGDDALLVRSRVVVSAMHRRARERGTWALVRRPHRDAEHAGLFRGLAGIGWHMLRQLAPERLPSIGVLEG